MTHERRGVRRSLRARLLILVVLGVVAASLLAASFGPSSGPLASGGSLEPATGRLRVRHGDDGTSSAPSADAGVDALLTRGAAAADEPDHVHAAATVNNVAAGIAPPQPLVPVHVHVHHAQTAPLVAGPPAPTTEGTAPDDREPRSHGDAAPKQAGSATGAGAPTATAESHSFTTSTGLELPATVGTCSIAPSFWLQIPKTGTSFSKVFVSCACPKWEQRYTRASLPAPDTEGELGPWFMRSARRMISAHPDACDEPMRSVLSPWRDHMPLPYPLPPRGHRSTSGSSDEHGHGHGGDGDDDDPIWNKFPWPREFAYPLPDAQSLDVLVMIRHPARRVNSAYNHRVQSAGKPVEESTRFWIHGLPHKQQKQMRQTVTTLRQFATWPGISGCQTRMLSGFRCISKNHMQATQDDVDEAVRRLRHGAMAFVGITDHWELTVWLFHRKFGGRVWPDELEKHRSALVVEDAPDSGSDADDDDGGDNGGDSGGGDGGKGGGDMAGRDAGGSAAGARVDAQAPASASAQEAEVADLIPDMDAIDAADMTVYRVAAARFVADLLAHGFPEASLPQELVEDAAKARPR